MLRFVFRPFGALLLVAVLGGCSGLTNNARSFALYDLGLSDPVPVPDALRPASIELRTPSWLGTGAMQYRLAYVEPHRRLAYTESRWTAQPAEMLRLGLDRALRGPAAPDSGCRLRIEVDELMQVFDSVDRSYVHLAVRASLLPLRSENPLAGRDVNLRVRTPTADAQGGVLATRAAMQQLAAELGGWLDALDQPTAQGLNGGAGCRPR